MLAPESLRDWQRWRRSRAGLLDRRQLRGERQDTLGLFTARDRSRDVGDTATVIVALDSVAPTQRAALLRPAELLMNASSPMAVLAPNRLAGALATHGLKLATEPGDTAISAARQPRAVLAVTHVSGAGAAAWQLARGTGAPFFVVQHGVVTPYSPPLPPDGRLLAWSEEDARFWRSGRRNLTHVVVGSQILWEARAADRPNGCGGPLSFLGQLHSSELPRALTRLTVTSLAAEGPLLYRPHPNEIDLPSRCQHYLWRARGIRVDNERAPLAEGTGTVVGIFSTGILEAAAAGRRAFGYCVRPPRWVEELWDRYGVARLGGTEGTRVELGADEPSRVILEVLDEVDP